MWIARLPPSETPLPALDIEGKETGEGDVVGSVQVAFHMAPNGRFRSEVRKLIVDERYQRRGIGRTLMLELEKAAKENGSTLCVSSPYIHPYSADGIKRAGEDDVLIDSCSIRNKEGPARSCTTQWAGVQLGSYQTMLSNQMERRKTGLCSCTRSFSLQPLLARIEVDKACGLNSNLVCMSCFSRPVRLRPPVCIARIESAYSYTSRCIEVYVLASMTLKSLTQPFKATFQPLPSTPIQTADKNTKSKSKVTPKSKVKSRKLTSKRQPGPKSPRVPPSPRKFDTWSGSSLSTSRTRRATKAAIALRQLILDDTAHRPAEKASLGPVKGVVGSKKTTVPRLRGKDIERLQTQLLKPDLAGLVIAQARTLRNAPTGLGLGEDEKGGSAPRLAVCLDVNESMADGLLASAVKDEKTRHQQEEKLAQHRYSTIKAAPPPPSRLPIILSLLEALPDMTQRHQESATVFPLGLMSPPSALSLRRPLAGALPTPETLRRGFDALLNAESKVYRYEGPSHKGLYPPTDRLSIYTCKRVSRRYGLRLLNLNRLVGFRASYGEFSQAVRVSWLMSHKPPPTVEYLSRVKQISTSLLNLLGIIVFAVPGGTRELAPFVGVLSRFIETE